MKKKSTTKPAAKKSAKRSRARGKRKDKNPAEVRKDISKLVTSHTTKLAKAVINQGEQGQLATVKYLWELASIFPPSTDGSEATRDEDCLAKTLLDRLNVPDTPVVADQGDEDVMVTPAQTGAEKKSEVGGEKKSEPEAAELEKDAVLV